MSKKNLVAPVSTTTVENISMTPETEVPVVEKMAEVDRLSLELAKSNRKTALAEAQTALAKNDNAELNYKYVVLQIYMKYRLTEADAITESGEIRRGAALAEMDQVAAKV